MVEKARAHGAEHMVRAFRALALLLTVAAAGCSVENTTAPPLSGPSELGLSLTLAATPDILSQDGGSQSRVEVFARDGDGRARSGVTLRLDITVGGQIVDFGTLSSKTVVTGGDGRASAAYTAPRGPVTAVDSGTIVTVLATPINGNFANAVARSVDIRLVPTGVILPPSDLQPGFTVLPSSPTEFETVVFTAPLCPLGATSPDGCTIGSVVSYAWNFGDGGTASGQVATHQFAAGNFAVTLTVRDAGDRAASTTKALTVKAGSNPAAAFVVSPSAPLPDQTVFFNAATSTASGNRTLVDFQWNFGDGNTGRGMNVSHAYPFVGAYTVTLTVVDDAGRTATATQALTVSTTPPPVAGGPPTATFTVSPTSPTATAPAVFDATASAAVAPATIQSYAWDFGDGSIATGAIRSKTFAVAGSYQVTLSVTDSSGAVGRSIRTVTVQ
jgi:PKD repeat protein